MVNSSLNFTNMNNSTLINKIKNWFKETSNTKITLIICATVVVLFLLDICVTHMQSIKSAENDRLSNEKTTMTLEEMVGSNNASTPESSTNSLSTSELSNIPTGNVKGADEVASSASVDLKHDFSDIVCGVRLQESDIATLSKPQLRILRNTIYARHGRKFKSEDLRNYFNSFSWYRPLYDEIAPEVLSDIEKHNIQIIKMYE